MKNLNEYIKESLLDDEDELVGDDTHIIEDLLKQNYIITGGYAIKNDKIIVGKNAKVSDKNIEDLTCGGAIQFDKTGKSFDCIGCTKLKTFKGSPRYVGLIFWAQRCNNIETLEGMPERVEGGVYIDDCEKIKNLEGSPKYIGGSFKCPVNIKSLKGVPEYIGGDLELKHCKELKEIDYIPKHVRTINLMSTVKIPDKFRDKCDFKRY